MRRLLFCLLALVGYVYSAHAQQVNLYCQTGTGLTAWQPASAANPCPITSSGGGSLTVTAAAALPTLSPGSNGLYESLSGGLYVNPAYGTSLAAVGSGAMNGGTPRIALATDSPGIITLGQCTMSCSVPVAIASDQSSVPVSISTSTSSTAAVAYSSSTVLAANRVIKASAGNLYGFDVVADSTLNAAQWYVLIFDATAAPGDGTVTPAKCYAIPSGSSTISAALTVPIRFATGVTITASSTGCFTKTASTHAFISGDVQ